MSVPPSSAAPGGQPAPFGNQPPAGHPGAPGTPAPGQFAPPPGQPAGAPQAFPPPGQPGQPGAFGPPPGQPFGPPPGQPAKKKPVWIRFVVPAVVAVVAIGGWLFFNNSGVNGAQVGDCLHIAEFNSDTDPEPVDCNANSANTKIAIKLDSASDSCPTGDYDEYSVTGRRTNSYRMCLMINGREGDCFANISDTSKGYERVPCTDPAAELEIKKVVTGQADDAACEGLEIDVAIKYSEPATTMCARFTSGARA